MKPARCVLRDIEIAILGPSKESLRQTHFFDAERLAMRVPGILFVRAAVSDVGTRDDERRSILGGPRGRQRPIDRRGILSVDLLHLPAVRFEATADILREREI